MITYYFDEHMRRIVAETLIQRGFPVVMAADVGMIQKEDDTEHLPYAIEHGYVLVTFDRGFAGRTVSNTMHPGFICLSESIRNNIGKIIEILVEFAELYDPEKDKGLVFWLP